MPRPAPPRPAPPPHTGVLWAALDERFVDPTPSSTQAAVMAAHLGAAAPSAPDVYRSCVLPRLGALEPALRDAAVLALLRSLAALEAEDPRFVRDLREVSRGGRALPAEQETPSDLL
jgi:hypothetical protein